jgi:hypothetical protein
MVSYARFTRSETSTARGQRALNRSTIAVMPPRIRYKRESSATSDRNARARYDEFVRVAEAAAADQVIPPSPIRPVPMPDFTDALRNFEELQDRLSRLLTQTVPVANTEMVPPLNASEAAALSALLLPSPTGFPAPVAADWGPRRRPAGRRIQLSQAFDNSPIRRPQFVGVQRRLTYPDWCKTRAAYHQLAEPASPQQDTVPASPSSPMYSPTPPSTGPPSPFDPSWSPTPAQPLEMSALAVAIEVEPEVVAAPRQIIDLTDDSMDGSKECPIEL